MNDVMERVRVALSRPCADCGITPALVLWHDKETRLCRSCSSIRHGHHFEDSPSFHDFMQEVNAPGYVEVEVRGGPQHGKVYAVQNYMHHLAIAKLKPLSFDQMNETDTIVAFDQIILPIQRTTDGRHFVEWPED
jgi:hypothetical protein